MRRRTWSSARRSRWSVTASSSRSRRSTASRSCTFCSKREVRRVADRVGECAGIRDRAHERGDAPVVAAHLEDLLDDRAVLALELLHAPVDGLLLVGPLLDLDAQAALRIGVRGARDPAVQAGQRHGAASAGKAHGVDDVGNRADGGKIVLVARNEQHALLVADVHGQRDVHVGKDDDVFERNEQQGGAHQIISSDTWAACATKYTLYTETSRGGNIGRKDPEDRCRVA